MYRSRNDQIVGDSGCFANIERLPNFTGARVPRHRRPASTLSCCCRLQSEVACDPMVLHDLHAAMEAFWLQLPCHSGPAAHRAAGAEWHGLLGTPQPPLARVGSPEVAWSPHSADGANGGAAVGMTAAQKALRCTRHVPRLHDLMLVTTMLGTYAATTQHAIHTHAAHLAACEALTVHLSLIHI